jgi:hypothetical protein
MEEMEVPEDSEVMGAMEQGDDDDDKDENNVVDD